MLSFGPLTVINPDLIEALLDSAFGRERHQRTAYALRRGLAPLSNYSGAAHLDNALVGTIQCWPVRLDADDGSRARMILVGPVAVSPAHQNTGIGRALLKRSLFEMAHIGETRPQMLIGDPEYYGRFFGFTAARTGQWRLPGPFEPHRLLARGPEVPDRPGIVVPDL